MKQPTPIPKMKPEPENDEFQRNEFKGFVQRKNEADEVREFLSDEDNLQRVTDYIFGVIDENPLEEIRNSYKEKK